MIEHTREGIRLHHLFEVHQRYLENQRTHRGICFGCHAPITRAEESGRCLKHGELCIACIDDHDFWYHASPPTSEAAEQ